MPEVLHAEEGMSPDEWWDYIVSEGARRYSNVKLARAFVKRQFDAKPSLYRVLAKQKMVDEAETQIHRRRHQMRQQAERECVQNACATRHAQAAAKPKRPSTVQKAMAAAQSRSVLDRWMIGDKRLRSAVRDDLREEASRLRRCARGNIRRAETYERIADKLPDGDTPVDESLDEDDVARILKGEFEIRIEVE